MTIRSARMTREPWVSTTFPSKVAIFLASSAIMLSDSMLTDFSRSARSAKADPAANAHAAARPRAAAAPALFPGRRIEGGLDLRLQRELLFLVVHHHADPAQNRTSLRNRDCLVATRNPLLGEHMQEFGARAKFRPLRRGLAQDHHIAVKEGLLPLSTDCAAIRRRGEIAAVFGAENVYWSLPEPSSLWTVKFSTIASGSCLAGFASPSEPSSTAYCSHRVSNPRNAIKTSGSRGVTRVFMQAGGRGPAPACLGPA